MPRHFLRRYLPSDSSLRRRSALRPLGSLLHNPQIWHLHRRSVSGATFIGLFCALLPLPFQMLFAASLAIATRCNLPISVMLVWVTNPLTIAPIFYFAYKLGAWLLDVDLAVSGVDQLNWSWLAAEAGQIWQPLLLGALVCGWFLGTLGFALVRVAWRWRVIHRWHERRRLRRLRTAPGNSAPASDQPLPNKQQPLGAPVTHPAVPLPDRETRHVGRD